MKKVILATAIASMAFTSTAMAGDNLFLSSDTGINARFQQQQQSAARIGLTYSFKFGGKKTEQDKYGTLNIQILAGRKVPVMNFGVDGLSATSNLVKLSATNDSPGGFNWTTIAFVGAGVVGAVLLLKGESDSCPAGQVILPLTGGCGVVKN